MAATNRKQFLKLHGLPEDTSLNLNQISILSGMPEAALQAVFNRGIGAWKGSPESVRLQFSFHKKTNAPRQSRLGKEQWAYGRVYAFVMKTKKVYYEADNDIREGFGLA
jgi:hypothetical protein